MKFLFTFRKQKDSVKQLLNISASIVLLIFFFSCDQKVKNKSNSEQSHKKETNTGDISSKKIQKGQLQSKETRMMVEELKSLLIKEGTSANVYRNRALAESYLKKMNEVRPELKGQYWFNYVYQMLLAGENKVCLKELNAHLEDKDSKFPYEDQLNEKNKPLFDLLALAYLRLGERENCQLNHTAQSCIIPIREEGTHQLKEGSQKSIEVYELLEKNFPNPKYKWILNVAHMTLGNYPAEVSSDYFIEIPNKTERKSFPIFKDVAMNLGLSVDGYAGSTCIDDFNNDGFLDIFTTSSGMEDNVQLFINDQKGGFKNTTNAAGLKGILGGFNCIQADYDNDGDKDIFVLRGAWLGKAGNHPNSLLKNMGDGTFQDVSRSSNILSYHPTQTACWGDFNRDGHLDLFIGNESSKDDIHPCELYVNNGDGTFSEKASSYGLDFPAIVKSVAWGDINNDGWPDLYVSRLGGPNLLFKNEKGFFREIAEEAGVREPIRSFPIWFWDVNNDGLEDLLVLTYDLSEPGMSGQYAQELLGMEVSGEKPILYINQGDNTFSDRTEEFNLSKPMAAMGANFGDIDNDGYLDFYVGTGAPRYTAIVPNRMFRNVEGKKFEEVTSAGNFGNIQKGHGISFADLDRDGDQDIYAVMGGFYEGDNYPNILYENPISENNWIVIELEGTKSNRSAIGAKIKVELPDGKKLFRTVSSGGSFGASPLHREIGLGKNSQIKRLTINWPNSKSQVFTSIEVNQKVLIKEGVKELKKVNYQSTPFKKIAHEAHQH